MSEKLLCSLITQSQSRVFPRENIFKQVKSWLGGSCVHSLLLRFSHNELIIHLMNLFRSHKLSDICIFINNYLYSAIGIVKQSKAKQNKQTKTPNQKGRFRSGCTYNLKFGYGKMSCGEGKWRNKVYMQLHLGSWGWGLGYSHVTGSDCNLFVHGLSRIWFQIFPAQIEYADHCTTQELNQIIAYF